MIVEFSVFDTEYLLIEHLSDTAENIELIKDFAVGNEASGLEDYLKFQALEDEKNNNSRTYLVKDKISKELVGYFSLRTGLITIQIMNDSFDSIPAIELANFAVNKRYKESHPDAVRLGAYMLDHFIYPLARCMANYVGVNSLYIYAVPEEKLIEHYKRMGFSRLPETQEKFVQHHVKPKYDEGCIFMYQTL